MHKIKTRWATIDDAGKLAKIDLISPTSTGPWKAADFELFMVRGRQQVMLMTAGRRTVSYACVFRTQYMLRLERVNAVTVPGDKTDYEITMLLSLIEFVKQTPQLRLEVRVAADDTPTQEMLGELGFQAEPWADGRHIRANAYRLCYRNKRNAIT